jgi:polar amino acid transport system permease protein
MTSDFLIVFRHFDQFLGGLWNTLWLAGATLVLASTLGCAIAALMLARQRVLRKSIAFLVDAMRCVPFLLLAYLVYYGLPELGLQFDSWTCGISALVLYHSAYIAEIVRGAWSNLAHEQIDAGKAFGFHGYKLFQRIILPQLFFASAPVIGNQTVQILKDTAFLMIITVPELTFVASSIQATYFVPFAAFIVAMLLYWAVTLVIEAGVRRIELSAAVRRAA